MRRLKRPIDNSDPQIWRLKSTVIGYARAYQKQKKVKLIEAQQTVLRAKFHDMEFIVEGLRDKTRRGNWTILDYRQCLKLESRIELLKIMRRSMDGERIKLVICVREVIEPFFDDVKFSLNNNLTILDEV